MPVSTRSHAKNTVHETSGNSSAQSKERLRQKFANTANTADTADGPSDHPVVLSCSKCSAKGDGSIQTTFEAVPKDVNCCWLCEQCYKRLPVDLARSSFKTIPNNGAFFERSEYLLQSNDKSRWNSFPDSSPILVGQRLKAFSLPLLAILEWMKKFLSRLSPIINRLFTYFSEFTFTLYYNNSKDFVIRWQKYFGASFLIFVILAVSLPFLYGKTDSSVEPNAIPIEDKISDSLYGLFETFPQQGENLRDNFVSGFNEIATSGNVAPAVFLVVHSNDTKTFKCILKKVCDIAHQYLNVSPAPLEVDGGNLLNEYSDHGEFIVDMKKKLKTTRITVINNLHKLPSRVAPALHGLTDAYNPLVKNVVFIMSFPMNDSLSHSSSIFQFAEDVLSETWADLKDETIGPLITRLTTRVMLLKDEVPLPDIC